MKEYEPLANHTVFRIGGPARFFVAAKTEDDVLAAISQAKQQNLSWIVIGAGSNVLISDAGYPGVVIQWTGGAVEIHGTQVVATAATPMAQVVAEASRAGLAGFEWAIGVPGTIGGSVVGNAGCFGGDMASVVEVVRVFDVARGAAQDLPASALEFSYRDSHLKRQPDAVVFSVTLRLVPGDPATGVEKVREYTARRVQSQDIGAQCAGCMFKNVSWDRPDVDRGDLLGRFPELGPFRDAPAIPTGLLIERVGLKGRRIGNIEISQRHGNFFVNLGGGSARDVASLIQLAKEEVRRQYGIVLEEEIRYIGFDAALSCAA